MAMKSLPRASIAWAVPTLAAGLALAGSSAGRSASPGLAAPQAESATVSETSAATPGSMTERVLFGAGPPYSVGEFLGPASCASGSCHGSSLPRDEYDVLQNEYTTWIYEDAHRRAHDVLLGEESKLIARNLGLTEVPEAARSCLACHALRAPRGRRGGVIEAADGVSCEACHGPAGGWLARHSGAGWSHADSLAHGMIDMRNRRIRARVCLGCHAGEGERQVDHEMLAAGHPQLVFELDHYSYAMPAHWRPFAELRDREGRRDKHGVAAWSVGQVEAFRHGLELLAWRIEDEGWPEFSEMSCDTCHHSLAEGQWRQLRGFRFRAGQPSWSPARWVVLRRLVELSAPEELTMLDQQVEVIEREVARFGAPSEELAAAIEEAGDGLARVFQRVALETWPESRVRALIAALIGTEDDAEPADRLSAAQIAMALESLIVQLVDESPRSVSPEAQEAVESLFVEVEDPYRYDRQRFTAALSALAAELR